MQERERGSYREYNSIEKDKSFLHNLEAESLLISLTFINNGDCLYIHNTGEYVRVWGENETIRIIRVKLNTDSNF